MSLSRFRRGQSVHEPGFAEKLNDIIDAVEEAQDDITTLDAGKASSSHAHSGTAVTLSTTTPTSGLTGIIKAASDTLDVATANVDYAPVTNPRFSGGRFDGTSQFGDTDAPTAGTVVIADDAGNWTTLTCPSGTTDLAVGGTTVSLVGHAHAGADITSGVVGKTYGGAGDVNGILTANGAGTVSAVAAGGIADSLLTSNVVLKNAANTFSAGQTIAVSGTTPLALTSSGNERATFASTGQLTLKGNGTGGLMGLFAYVYGVGGTSSVPVFRGWNARGDQSSPTATKTGDYLMQLSGGGYGATGYSSSSRAALNLKAGEDWTDSAQGSYLEIETTPNGSATRALRLSITPGGLVGIGAMSPTYALHIAKTSGMTAGQTVFIQDATATTGKTGVVIKAGAGDGASDKLLNVQDAAGTSLMSVTQDGTFTVGAGKIADSLLTSNVPLKNAANTFTTGQVTQPGSRGAYAFSLNDTTGTDRGGLYLGSSGDARMLLKSSSGSDKISLYGSVSQDSFISCRNTGIGTTAPSYSLHVAPTAGATAGQTVFVQDATATTGETGVVIKAGAGNTAEDAILQIQSSAGAVGMSIPYALRDAADDAAAAALSPAVPVGGLYRNGSVVMQRIA